MRQYEPIKGASLTKQGPDFRYVFKRGVPTGPKTREDEMWMDRLAANGVLRIVVDTNPGSIKDTEPKKKVPEGIRHTSAKDFNLPEPKQTKVPREKGYKTPEEKQAEIEVKRVEEQLKESVESQEPEKFEDEEIQEFFEFIKSLRGKNYDELVEAINIEYYKKPLVSLCEKLELDTEGNKPDLAGRLLDWFSLKGK